MKLSVISVSIPALFLSATGGFAASRSAAVVFTLASPSPAGAPRIPPASHPPQGGGHVTCPDHHCDHAFLTLLCTQRPPRPCHPCEQADATSHSIPVGIFNGELQLSVVDLEVASRGFPFQWIRTYSSRADFDFGLGHNWSYNYQRRIGTTRAGNASVVDGMGREDLHAAQGGGVFSTPQTIYETLVQNLDNTFTQTAPDGMRYSYDGDGYLVAMEDRNGNRLTIERNSFHNITKLHDTQDREYTVAYTDNTPGQRVASLTDFMGRQVIYTYDNNGDLIRVRSPIVAGTPNGNDFPEGKTTLYTYSSGLSRTELDHNLLSIIEPAYNVANNPALSKAAATLTYSSATDPDDPSFDRVVAERWGHDQGGSPGAPIVGGTATFEYANDLSTDLDAPPGATNRTRETDRNGNVRIHYFDDAGHELKTIVRTNRGIRPGEGDYITLYSYTTDGLLSCVTNPRGNATCFLYDSCNPDRRRQGNLLERRVKANGVAGGGVDLVTRYTYEPIFNQLRTTTDPRAFPTGSVPLVSTCALDLGDPLVQRYTTTVLFDYQEGTGFQASQGVPAGDQIPEGLGDLNGAPDFDEGNFIRVVHPTILTAGPNLGDVIVETRTFNDRGQLLTATEPEGHVTAYEYFPTNGIPSDPSDLEGYLKSRTVDFGASPHFNIRTTYGYDLAGNLTSLVDPKGQETTFVPNALNQVVRVLSRRVLGTTRYQTDTFYDANDNVMRTERTSIDENGAAYAHGVLTDTFEHNILNFLIATTRDKTRNDGTGAGSVRTEYFYDRNMNRTAVKLPLAVAGTQTSNILTYQYDERDLLYKTITGDNDTDPFTAPPTGAVVVTLNYDPNRNLLERIDSLPHAQSPNSPVTLFTGSAGGDVRPYGYDGFDRLVSVTDPEANLRSYTYDLASNRVQERLNGPADHTGGPSILLTQVDQVHDEINRLVRSDALHFETATGLPIGDGHSVTELVYDLNSQIVRVTDDRNLSTTTVWDTADRVEKTIDHLGNETELTYDPNSNVIRSARRDVSTDLGSPPETFVTRMGYDGLDRLVRTIDPAGDIREYAYDSRGNFVRTSDGVRGTGQPSVVSIPGQGRRFAPLGFGNVVTYEYDGLDRLVRTARSLTSNGRGDGSPAGSILTTQAWDDDSRLVAQTDDNGHSTSYSYDALNRLTVLTYADGSGRTTAFDTDNHVTSWTDQNGTTCTMTYDGLDRLLSRNVGPQGVGVIGSTLEEFGYDGASRVTLARNNDGFNPGTMDCLFAYDSLSNRTQDEQMGIAVLSDYDGVGNRTRCTYPAQFGGGSRVLDYVIDGLNRVASISGPGTIAEFHYKGPERLERRTYGNGTKLDIAYDALRRPIDFNHTTSGGGPIARFQYGYDREHHRLFEKRVHDGNLGDVYSYDSVYRVTGNLLDVDLSAVAPGTEILPETYSSPDGLAYAYDGVGNRTTTTETAGGVPAVSTYFQQAGGASCDTDAEVNQYTSVSGALNFTFAHDCNGNMASDGPRTYAYDFKNRLVEVRDQSTTSLIARYIYDAADRRSSKQVGDPGPVTHYIFDGDQVVEERDSSNALTRQYVWGPGVDELLEERSIAGPLYAHENSIGSVAALTDASGAVVERYQYDPFGNTTVTLDGGSGNEYRFQTIRLDLESDLYHMRARHYDQLIGRFLQRDPIGIWTDSVNLGNGYSFVSNNAINNQDSMGLDVWIEGPSGDEPSGHQSINVGDPNGDYVSVSFGAVGPSSTQIIEGEVYVDEDLGGAIDSDYYLKTSAEEDARVRAFLNDLIGQHSRYGINATCRDFSQEAFAIIEDHNIGKPAPPPVRKDAPRKWYRRPSVSTTSSSSSSTSSTTTTVTAGPEAVSAAAANTAPTTSAASSKVTTTTAAGTSTTSGNLTSEAAQADGSEAPDGCKDKKN